MGGTLRSNGTARRTARGSGRPHQLQVLLDVLVEALSFEITPHVHRSTVSGQTDVFQSHPLHRLLRLKR
eukprot:49915-Eustigmatos_ZCMA.PRE.1